MNMERVEELVDIMVDSARLNHEVSVDHWKHGLLELFKQQQEQMERYEKSLEFYANRQAYYCSSDHDSEVMNDYGKIARAALDQ